MTPPRSEATSTDAERPGESSREERARHRMVERQLRRRGVLSDRVLEAMASVPREQFVSPERRWRAYHDGAIRIEGGQTISQPWIVARMTELLDLEGDERVLEVGTGSGYGAAILSRCAAEVLSIERLPELADAARAKLERLGYDNVEVRVGDGSAGAPDRAPFDGISVTATAADRPPPALVEQLAPGAALVCPVRSSAGEYLLRLRDGVQETIAPVRFVPLIGQSDEA